MLRFYSQFSLFLAACVCGIPAYAKEIKDANTSSLMIEFLDTDDVGIFGFSLCVQIHKCFLLPECCSC